MSVKCSDEAGTSIVFENKKNESVREPDGKAHIEPKKGEMKYYIDVLNAYIRQVGEGRVPPRAIREFLRYGLGRRLTLAHALTEVLVQHRPELVHIVLREKQIGCETDIAQVAAKIASRCMASMINEAPREEDALRTLEYMLVEMGAGPDVYDELDDDSALVAAVKCGYLRVAARLLRAGAHVHPSPPTMEDLADIDNEELAAFQGKTAFLTLFTPHLLAAGPDSRWGARHLDPLFDAARENGILKGGM